MIQLWLLEKERGMVFLISPFLTGVLIIIVSKIWGRIRIRKDYLGPLIQLKEFISTQSIKKQLLFYTLVKRWYKTKKDKAAIPAKNNITSHSKMAKILSTNNTLNHKFQLPNTQFKNLKSWPKESKLHQW